jgi:4,5-DOPA dioxygenase extradiol
MKLDEFKSFSATRGFPEKMPVLFLGHGSPMNAIEENEFVAGFRRIGQEIPKPKAILCISAHWESRGTHVTAMSMPRTIHDFGGFPEELFAVQYHAPGSPELAREIKSIVKNTPVGLNDTWGLDHGAWSVIKHLYPNADVPVVQLSLDYNQTPQHHYNLAKDLASLRRKGVMIIGSGNMVHNLALIEWSRMNVDNYAYDWALEAKEKMISFIMNDDHQSLINYRTNGRAFQLSVPTPEHYLPLLYTLALKERDEQVSLFNDKSVAGSLAMTSVRIGRAG